MTPDSVRFFVPGIPAPGGSKRAFVSPKTGKVVVLDDAKGNGPWRERVAHFARQAWTAPPMEGPLVLWVRFVLPRPKGHFGAGKNARKVRPSAPAYPTTKPDATKLLRALEDALTGILWRDDAQVVSQDVLKCYGSEVGALVRLESLADMATVSDNAVAELMHRSEYA